MKHFKLNSFVSCHFTTGVMELGFFCYLYFTLTFFSGIFFFILLYFYTNIDLFLLLTPEEHAYYLYV